VEEESEAPVMSNAWRVFLAVPVSAVLLVGAACNGDGPGGSSPSSASQQRCPIVRNLESGITSLYDGAGDTTSPCRDVDLSGKTLAGATITNADLSGADLTDTDLSGADLKGTRLVGAKLVGANLRQARLESTDFTDADLTDADLSDAFAAATQFIGTTMVRTDLTGADVSSADFTDATLQSVALEPGSMFLWGLGLTRDQIAAALDVGPTDLTEAVRRLELEPIDPDALAGRLEPVCTGTALPGTPAPSGTGAHTLVVVVGVDDPGQERSFETPAAWAAPAVALADYVACVRTRPVEIQRCSYEGGGLDPARRTYIRYRQDAVVRVVEVGTARQVEQRVVRGADPKPCPAKTGVSGTGPVTDYGPWPASKVLSVAAPYVGALAQG
jgi:hypothetical protein